MNLSNKTILTLVKQTKEIQVNEHDLAIR